MIRQSLAASASPFRRPEKFEIWENLDFKNIKQLQNLGHFSLTASCRYITQTFNHLMKI